MVEAGMTEMEVLVAATINAADLIDMSDSIGTIEAGKFADIIAVDASPLDDIGELLACNKPFQVLQELSDHIAWRGSVVTRHVRGNHQVRHSP